MPQPEVFAPGGGRSVRETLLAAVGTGRAAGVKSVVGFGGGSPMDIAKLAATWLGSGDDLDASWGLDIAKGGVSPLALIPPPRGGFGSYNRLRSYLRRWGEACGQRAALIADAARSIPSSR